MAIRRIAEARLDLVRVKSPPRGAAFPQTPTCALSEHRLPVGGMEFVPATLLGDEAGRWERQMVGGDLNLVRRCHIEQAPARSRGGGRIHVGPHAQSGLRTRIWWLTAS